MDENFRSYSTNTLYPIGTPQVETSRLPSSLRVVTEKQHREHVLFL